ncbi:unnamed protein product [Leuciscus chuanchicus]
MSSDSPMWDSLTQSFNRVVALDFLGFGFSDKPNKRCVWTVTPSDVWTDIYCNDGLLLMDRQKKTFSYAPG